MKDTQKERFQEMLENRRDEILRSLTRVQKEGRSQQCDWPQDIGDRSVASFSRELLFQEATQKRQLLRRIDEALERIRQGTFGECLSCGNEINPKRLDAMPFTAYCRDCQENFERERSLERERPLGSAKSSESKSEHHHAA
jgi:DnaK suppressor protein